jgi:hypothetical protein
MPQDAPAATRHATPAALRDAERVRALPGRRGWYEVFYVTVALGGGRAAWLRYTLLAPRAGEATAALWGCAFDRGRPRWFAWRRSMPAGAWVPRPDGGVDLAGGGLGPLGCHGEVGDVEGRAMRWELSWEPLCEPFAPFPDATERFAGRATFPIAAVPLARATGFVEVDGERHACQGALLHQGHVFGGRHARRWGWVTALGFDADPEGMLSLIWARPQRLGGLMPAASSLALRLHGRLHRSTGLRVVRWSDGGGEEVHFQGRAGEVEVYGSVRAATDWLIGVTYSDPDGAAVHCANTEVADLDLQVMLDGVEERLRCDAACGFERGGRSPMPGIWRPL